VLNKLLRLAEINDDSSSETTIKQQDLEFKIGVGLDSAIIPLSRSKDLFLVQSVDYFYPLIDDPFLMGKIAFANVVSDIYSTGVTQVEELKIIINIPEEFTDEERDYAVPLIIDGFRDSAKEAKCRLAINSIGINPWCMIGGIATSVCTKDEIKFPIHAQAGDALILTKPLGTRLATNGPIWMKAKSPNWDLMSPHLTPQQINETADAVIQSMAMLNKVAAELMHKYDSHAATDITGFGLVGHGENLLSYQKQSLDFIIESMPLIKHVPTIASSVNQLPRLLGGKMVETSGGLLIALPSDNAQAFCDDFRDLTGKESWIVGKVVQGNRKVIIKDDIKIIEAN
jgi:selenide,water dikinase